MPIVTFLARKALFTGAASCALLAGLIVGGGIAWADTPVQAEPTTVPELVITAERRVENLQTVPVSATVLNAQQLEEQGVNRVADLQRIAPSLAINTYNRSTFINIRGVGIAVSAPTSTPGVAYYIDGQFIPHELNIGNTFYDIGSVEVLRGPQGTLTGQNSTGGAIYVRTPAPTFDHLSAYVDQTIGNYSWFRTVAAANIPYNDALALRVAGVRETRDSFTSNSGGGNQVGNVSFESWRANLEFRPNDAVQANLTYQNDHNSNNGNAYKNRADVTHGPFTVEEDAQGYFHQGGWRAGAELQLRVLPLVRLRYLFNYQQGNVTDLVDGDRGLFATSNPRPNNGRLGYTSTTNNVRIHEIDAISQGSGPFQWVVGGFFLDEHVPVTLLTYGADTVSPLHAPTATTVLSSTNTSRSVFGQASYRFNPQWQLTIGARESWDKQVFARLAGALPGGLGTTQATSQQPTGRIALNYNPTDNVLLYAAVARGYKAGGVNLIIPTGNFSPETNTLEEIGVKMDLMQRHLRVDGAVFTSQYNNIQLSSLTPTTNLPFTENLPRSTTSGGELELTGVFDALQFNVGLAYLRARTDSAVILTDNTSNPSVQRLLPSGSQLPFAPQWTINAGIQYDFAVGAGRLTPRLQMNYASTQYGVIFANANSIVPARTLLDFRLTWAPNPALQVEGFVTNLTNKTYIAAQIQDSSSANGGIIYGAPRQVGVRIIARYH